MNKGTTDDLAAQHALGEGLDAVERDAGGDEIEQVVELEVAGEAAPDAIAVVHVAPDGVDPGEVDAAQDEGHDGGLDTEAAGQPGERDDAAVLGGAQDVGGGAFLR